MEMVDLSVLDGLIAYFYRASTRFKMAVLRCSDIELEVAKVPFTVTTAILNFL